MCFWNCELICWKKILPSRHNFLTTKINKNNQQVFIYMFTFSKPETHRGPKVRKSKRRRSIKRQPWSRLKHLERTWGPASATTESVRNQHLEPAGTIRNKKFKNSHQKYQEIYHKMITKIVCVCIVFIQKLYIKYEILLRSTSSFHGKTTQHFRLIEALCKAAGWTFSHLEDSPTATLSRFYGVLKIAFLTFICQIWVIKLDPNLFSC